MQVYLYCRTWGILVTGVRNAKYILDISWTRHLLKIAPDISCNRPCDLQVLPLNKSRELPA